MRHRVYGKHLNRTKNQRTALFKGLVRSLILHESINTTSPKAKAIKGLVDRVIVKAKKDSYAGRNFLQGILPEKEVRKKLIEEIVPRYEDRHSGFTQIARLGVRRGDGAMIVRMRLVEGGKAPKKAKEEAEVVAAEVQEPEKLESSKKEGTKKGTRKSKKA